MRQENKKEKENSLAHLRLGQLKGVFNYSKQLTTEGTIKAEMELRN